MSVNALLFLTWVYLSRALKLDVQIISLQEQKLPFVHGTHKSHFFSLWWGEISTMYWKGGGSHSYILQLESQRATIPCLPLVFKQGVSEGRVCSTLMMPTILFSGNLIFNNILLPWAFQTFTVLHLNLNSSLSYYVFLLSVLWNQNIIWSPSY